jgi:hypothetical protein
MRKAPRTKFQAPEKLQHPNFVGEYPDSTLTFRSLLIGASLELGTWFLELRRK